MNEPDASLETTAHESAGPTPCRLPAGLPACIGRYRIEKVLGKGAFGTVYLAHDEDLKRPVAVKVPNRERLFTSKDAEAYLAEARVVATLDHPNIVPVYDVGRTEDGLCFIVSKFIEGNDLATTLRRVRFPVRESVELVASIADALHHAHHLGLVHRDVKPGNILLDPGSKPHLADFGVALKEEDFGRGARFTGTPAYMSPEQARAKGTGSTGGRIFSAWGWCSTSCSRPGGHFRAIRFRRFSSRLQRWKPGRRDKSMTPFPESWNASA